jgi:hypothetical protein
MRAARLVRRINRAQADKLLFDFLRSVEDVNAHPDLLHWVTDVRVFGSYLTNCDHIGDIKIVIKTERRPAGSFDDASGAIAHLNGNSFGTDHDIAFFLNRMVARLLKGGSRYISLHGAAERNETFECGGKTVYSFAPPQRT